MTGPTADSAPGDAPPGNPEERPPCPVPADIRRELALYDAHARTRHWDGPHYRMTIRTLGQGPPLLLVPGLASTYRIYALLLNRLSARFQTIVYDYPGDQRDDRAKLAKIRHRDLADDLFGLLDHLHIRQAFLLGISFGATVVLRALHRGQRRVLRAALVGGFAQRHVAIAERIALQLARLVPGSANRLPFRRAVLTYNSKLEFPSIIQDRFPFYLEQNGLTPIKGLAHRAGLLVDLDLRPILSAITSEVMLIHGNEDRIVPRSDFDLLKSALPGAESMILPTVGHQVQLSHAELLARVIGDWFLPPAAEGYPAQRSR
jgi:pimeloyl-ACP methyl ester carboxylesterase